MTNEKDTREAFIERLWDYLTDNPNYDQWSSKQLVEHAIDVLFDDMGAAQQYLDLMEIDVDLFADPE